MQLLEGYLNKDRSLHGDHFYSGTPKTAELYKHETLICGALRVHRKGIPQEIKGKIKKGNSVSDQCNSRTKIIRWVDKGSVLMLSSVPKHKETLQ